MPPIRPSPPGNLTCTQNPATQGLCPQYSFSASTNQISNSGYTYDASGDLTNDGTHSYQYDAEGRLISVDGGNTASYVYNALGWRVETTVSGTTTDYVYDQNGNPIGSRIPAYWVAYFIDFQGRHLAHYQNREVYFIHTNALGTTGIVTDYTGAVVQDELHYPWGQEWTMVGTLEEERFALLQHRDTETGFDPTDFRMYSSADGRWQTPDPMDRGSANPMDPESWNRYAYALNNSTTLNDPTGLETSPCTIDGQPAFCTEVTVSASSGIDMGQFPSLPAITQDAMVAPATALYGDYVVATNPLNPFATAVFSQVGQDTGSLLSPWFYGGWYGSDVAVTAGMVTAYSFPQAGVAASAWAETYFPGSTGVVTDFVSGLEGNLTGSKASLMGYFIGNAPW